MDKPENRPKRKAPRTAYPKGKSGNPGGKPKNPLSLWFWVKFYLEKGIPRTRRELSPLQRLTVRWVTSATLGSDSDAWRWAIEILNRLDGKIPDRVEISDVAVSYVNDWRTSHPDSDAAPWDETGTPGSAPNEPDPGGPALA